MTTQVRKYLDQRYLGLALTRYYSNRIDAAQLADYLNVAPRNIDPLEEKFLGKGAFVKGA